MPRQKTKKRISPPKRGTADEAYNDFTAVLENLDDKIQVVAEGQMMLKERVDRIDGKIDEVKHLLEKLDLRLTRLEIKVEKIESDMKEVRAELKLIRQELREKASHSDFHDLEQRVAKLERQLAT